MSKDKFVLKHKKNVYTKQLAQFWKPNLEYYSLYW